MNQNERNEIKIDPAEVLRGIVANLAAECRIRRASKRRKQRPLWADIRDLSGQGRGYSMHIAQANGFDADTGETL